MSKLIIILIGVIVVVGGVGLAAYFLLNDKSNNNSADRDNTSQEQSDKNSTNSKIKLVDPNGDYNLYSDPSIITPPADNIEIGGGKTLTVEYDKSKGNILGYELYFIQENGTVVPMGGAFFNNDSGNIFTQEITVFNSSALESGVGFIELDTTSDDLITSKLGMYMVKFVE